MGNTLTEYNLAEDQRGEADEEGRGGMDPDDISEDLSTSFHGSYQSSKREWRLNDASAGKQRR